jgi:hypothetical protein
VIEAPIDRLEWGAVVVLDDDTARITVTFAGHFSPPYWKSRANDESTPAFHSRVIVAAQCHGPKLLRLTRERYEEICRQVEDGDDG